MPEAGNTSGGFMKYFRQLKQETQDNKSREKHET